MNVEFTPREAPERPGKDNEFQVGAVSVDPRTREVRFNGLVERLQDKPLSVLRLLAEHRGQLVTRETIIDRCWDGRIVGDDVINRAISILRKLGRRAGGFSIETLPRSGYRLIEAGNGLNRRSWVKFGAVAVGVTIALASYFWLRAPPPEPYQTLPSIAVAVDGNVPNTSLIHGELVKAIREIGYPVLDRDADMQVSAKATDNRGGPQIDIGLTSAGSDLPLLTYSFRRQGSSFADLSAEAVADTASSLAEAELLLRLMKNQGDIAERAALFSIVEQFRRFDVFRGRELAIAVARKFPDSPAVHYTLALARIFTMEGLPLEKRSEEAFLARRSLARGIALAPVIRDGGESWCITHPRVWMAECETRLRRSMENPLWESEARRWLVEIHAETGRFREGAQLSRFAVSDNPFHPRAIQQRLILLEITGHGREAETLYADAVRKFPEDWSIRWGRIIGLAAAGNFDRLATTVRAIPDSDFRFDSAAIQRVSGYYRSGDGAAIRGECMRPRLRGSTRHVCLSALSLLGETEAAISVAKALFPPIAGRDAAEDERLWQSAPNYFTTVFLSSPAGAPLRRDPRFDELAERTGLLRYWSRNRPDFCRAPAPEAACSRLFGRS